MPLRVIPDLSERPEHRVQSARAKGADVFDDRVLRARFGDDPVHFPPEAASLAPKSGALAGEADVLARKPSTDHIDRSNVSSPEGSDILKDRNLWPVLSEHCSAVGGDLTEGDGSHPCSFKPKAESSNTGKEIENTHHHVASCPMYADHCDRATSRGGRT